MRKMFIFPSSNLDTITSKYHAYFRKILIHASYFVRGVLTRKLNPQIKGPIQSFYIKRKKLSQSQPRKGFYVLRQW